MRRSRFSSHRILCAALLEDVRGHCRETSVSERDRFAAEALTGLLRQALVENAKIELTEGILERMRASFAAGTIRQACHGCQWSPLCDRIASGGFQQYKSPLRRPTINLSVQEKLAICCVSGSGYAAAAAVVLVRSEMEVSSSSACFSSSRVLWSISACFEWPRILAQFLAEP